MKNFSGNLVQFRADYSTFRFCKQLYYQQTLESGGEGKGGGQGTT